MASKTEGIALLSMYNDEEEEYEDDEEEQKPAEPELQAEAEKSVEREADGYGGGEDSNVSYFGNSYVAESVVERDFPVPQSRDLIPGEEISGGETLTTSSPSPTHAAMDYEEPPPQAGASEEIAIRSSRLALTIVDYAHDETAMSPENENGEIPSGARVFFGSEFHASIDQMQEKYSSSSSSHAVLTTISQISPATYLEQSSETKSEAKEQIKDQETLVVEMDVQQEDVISSNFLPPPVVEKCSEELQEKINKFLAYKRIGKSFNADLRNRKDYRNPDFLQHAVSYQDIDQHGTCFNKNIFDPHGFDKSDYYDAIEADMKREIERREQERKRSPKVEFLSGGIQPPIIIPTPKVSSQLPVPVTVSGASEGLPKEGRQNKKSKWDKVETEIKLPSTGGLDTILSAGAGGGGYTAFAEQKRREAMSKSSERKLDRRS